ncbi:hypothetical protein BUALT_BualtUnG0022000 [Buddleja alternifolia]|uniref:Uncharacterized protein n=1 Tax=Buddleja alternifolia TaxID=168488 RepID=A0AAV6W1B4_9LAMI|nr:hypothetical protein BUALT_BualtUnG0022000 [Buddleja alternifolia]
MAESTRFKDVLDAQKKQELLLLEERAQRQTSEAFFHDQIEHISHVQKDIQLTMDNNHKMLQQQLQHMVEQMQAYNRNKSVLGEGLHAPLERGSTSHQPDLPQTHTETTNHHNTTCPFPRRFLTFYKSKDIETNYGYSGIKSGYLNRRIAWW